MKSLKAKNREKVVGYLVFRIDVRKFAYEIAKDADIDCLIV